jgi:diaminopimelate epimerase
MCGNGIRCFAKYAIDRKLTKKTELSVETIAGIKKPKLVEGGMIRVDMGEPILERSQIPMEGPAGRVINEMLRLKSRVISVTAVSMGNPHAVVFVDTFYFSIEDVGKEIEHHPKFPKRTNVEFVQPVNDKELDMCVWERGAGVTLACGTGACAAAVASVLNKKASRNVTVHLLGGDLRVEWSEKDNHVYMTGIAETVFDGQVDMKKYL